MNQDGNMITVVDYSDAFFVELRQEPVPGCRGGKFVQIAHRGDHYFVFSPRDLSPYHADIVERFLALRGVEGFYNEKGDLFQPESREWEVVGGAHWMLDEELRVLRVYGESLAYGRLDLDRVAQTLRDAGAFHGIPRINVG
ncbi:MAG: hypothetical protein FJ276_03950 [Planctomycetes bacterium]|nr:hypothetical protein [Planctomycetota bacterium]